METRLGPDWRNRHAVLHEVVDIQLTSSLEENYKKLGILEDMQQHIIGSY